jgi:hypothetical protein
MLMAAALVALAGCGSSEKKGAAKAPNGEIAQPTAKEPLSVGASQLGKALETGKCADFAPVNLSFLRDPKAALGGPPVGEECKFIAPVLSTLKGFKPTKFAEYGTFGLAEGSIPRDGKFTSGDAFFVLDVDGRYRYTAFVPATPQIGTKPDAKKSKIFDDNAVVFLRALRERNCDRTYAYLNTIGTIFQLARGDRKKICEGFFSPGSHFAPQLAEDPQAKAVPLGKTTSFAVYGIATRKGYYTLLLTDQPGSAILKYVKIHPTFVKQAVYELYRNTK